MTHRITNGDTPYRSPNEVSDTPQRFNRTAIVIGAILLFVLAITAVASVMFFRISATPETNQTVSLKKFIEDPDWRGGKPEPDWEEQMK